MLEKILKVFGDNEVQIDPALKTAAFKVNPVRNSSVTLTSAGIILKYNHAAKQQSIISNGVKYTPSPLGFESQRLVGEEGTVPDLRTTYPYPPHRWGRERVGVKKLESPACPVGRGLSSKFDFEDLRKELISRKYSYKTIKGYIYYNRDNINHFQKIPSEIKDVDIKDYLVYLSEEKGAAISTLNQAINALKFYFGTILKKKFIYEVRRPRKDKKLPVVLSQEEVSKILTSVDNIKHKAILMLVYSAGLRVGEVVRLKTEDIDTNRKLIHIKGRKGGRTDIPYFRKKPWKS